MLIELVTPLAFALLMVVVTSVGNCESAVCTVLAREAMPLQAQPLGGSSQV